MKTTPCSARVPVDGAIWLAGICAQAESTADELGSGRLDDLLATFHAELRAAMACLAAMP